MTTYLSGGINYPIKAAGTFGSYLFIGFDRLVAGTEGEAALGVSLMASEAVNQEVPVKISGEVLVNSGADVATNNLTAGAAVTTDASGKAILADADTDYVLGRVSPGQSIVSTADTLTKIILCAEGRVASS